MFDRGIPDCITYAVVMDVDPAPSRGAAEAHRYHRDVLILEPWEEIYDTDDERTMSFDRPSVPRRAHRRVHTDRVFARRGAGGLIEDRGAFIRGSSTTIHIRRWLT